MKTLKRFQLLDALKVEKERIGKKAQQLILGGYGGYPGYNDGDTICKIFTSGCHCGVHLGYIFCKPTNQGNCMQHCHNVASAAFGDDYCCVCDIAPEW